MAAWTLPNRIADWCEILTTALDRICPMNFVNDFFAADAPHSHSGIL